MKTNHIHTFNPIEYIERNHLRMGFTCSDEFWKTFHGKQQIEAGIYVYSDEDRYKVHRNVLIIKSVSNGKWYAVMKNLNKVIITSTLKEAYWEVADMLAYPTYSNKPEIGCDCNCEVKF